MGEKILIKSGYTIFNSGYYYITIRYHHIVFSVYSWCDFFHFQSLCRHVSIHSYGIEDKVWANCYFCFEEFVEMVFVVSSTLLFITVPWKFERSMYFTSIRYNGPLLLFLLNKSNSLIVLFKDSLYFLSTWSVTFWKNYALSPLRLQFLPISYCTSKSSSSNVFWD